jgi:hypothetical protein
MENMNEQSTELRMKLPNPNETALVLVEILIYANNDEKSLLDAICENLQKQLDKLGKQGGLARVLWFSDAGEKSVFEKKEWLKTESNSMFYVFLDKYEPIEDNYLKKCISTAKKMRKLIAESKQLGLHPRAQKKADVQVARFSTIKDNYDNFDVL